MQGTWCTFTGRSLLDNDRGGGDGGVVHDHPPAWDVAIFLSGSTAHRGTIITNQAEFSASFILAREAPAADGRCARATPARVPTRARPAGRVGAAVLPSPCGSSGSPRAVCRRRPRHPRRACVTRSRGAAAAVRTRRPGRTVDPDRVRGLQATPALPPSPPPPPPLPPPLQAAPFVAPWRPLVSRLQLSLRRAPQRRGCMRGRRAGRALPVPASLQARRQHPRRPRRPRRRRPRRRRRRRRRRRQCRRREAACVRATFVGPPAAKTAHGGHAAHRASAAGGARRAARRARRDGRPVRPVRRGGGCRRASGAARRRAPPGVLAAVALPLERSSGGAPCAARRGSGRGAHSRGARCAAAGGDACGRRAWVGVGVGVGVEGGGWRVEGDG